MEKVGFLGVCDKTNLIMYVAKALVSMEKRVLVVDTSIEQRIKYIVPSINPTRSYVVEFENIDFAVGFENMQEVKRYLGIKEEITEEKSKEKMPYDYILLNIDSEKMIENFDIANANLNYFVTTFDMYSLRRGMEMLSNLKEPLKLTKILYSYDINREDEDYLNYLSMEYNLIWNDVSMYLPKIESDNQVIEENQRVYKLRIKRLSNEYQEGIIYIAQDILKEKNAGKIRKSIKE
jgi:hypothetical protein